MPFPPHETLPASLDSCLRIGAPAVDCGLPEQRVCACLLLADNLFDFFLLHGWCWEQHGLGLLEKLLGLEVIPRLMDPMRHGHKKIAVERRMTRILHDRTPLLYQLCVHGSWDLDYPLDCDCNVLGRWIVDLFVVLDAFVL